MCDKYGQMTVAQLKKILKQRNASLKGRKKDLIDRVVFYDKYDNFGHNEMEKDDVNEEVIATPSALLYKDLNSSDPVPKLTDVHIDEYLKRFDKSRGISEEMYNEGYLHFVRYCIYNQLYFVKGTCSAQMEKHVRYEINISLSFDGEIVEASCECTAGHSTSTHCKHVIVLLLGVRDSYLEKAIITHQSTTQSLQTFHQPSQKYTGSPIKAKNIITRKTKKMKLKIDDQYIDSQDYNNWYQNHFRNLIVNVGYTTTMPLKQLVTPANPYAILNDHNYTQHDAETKLLKELLLISISDEEIAQIELETRSQDNNPLWHEHRKHRLTASKFHECCKDLSEERGKALAKSILYPKHFTSKATSHGKIYESKAIEMFEEHLLQNQMKCFECGLFVMKSHPFIGASPDRLLAVETVVEVKCPYVSRDREINEITVPYLERDKDNNVTFKKNHQYYCQVQGQMMVTNRKYCDFIVYTFQGLLRVTIARDDQFISEMLQKLTNFYNSYFLPAILNKYIYKDYDKYF